jgi:DNA ligase-1
MIEVKYQRGVELPQLGLWLDPWDEKPLAFVSHAHSDHLGRHREIIASAGTATLMHERQPKGSLEHILEFNEVFQFRGTSISLLPAGHIFGSAQFFAEHDAGSLLYTGDFKLRPGLSAEPAQWRHAQILIMETTYGLPKYVFPPTEEVIARMVEFCREALDEGAVPVLLGYSLGKAQEILCALVRAGLTPMLHQSVHRMTEIYTKMIPEFPCQYEKYNAHDVAGKVLICPPSVIRSRMITNIKNRRTAVLTGWALDPSAHFRYQCDAAFPLSDHADYPDLLRYVELVKPERVLTLHGFAGAFARDLRERGIEAWALSQENQLELQLLGKPQSRKTAKFESHETHINASQSEFSGFAALCEQISQTPSKLKKIEVLRRFFLTLGGGDRLSIASRFLTGRAFAQSDQRTIQVGWAVIKRAILAVSGAGESEFRQAAHRHADAGKTAFEILNRRTQPRAFSLIESRELFDELHRTRGPIHKASLLESTLSRLSALEAQYLVKILTGALRIGLKEGLVEEALAVAFNATLDEVKTANMLLGDIGATALLAANGTLDRASLTLFRPIKCMLASPEPTAEAIWNRAGESSSSDLPPPGGKRFLWIEDKFDGIRAQLHCGKVRVEIFTRDLKLVTGQFSEIARAGQELGAEAILDGEIVAFEEGRRLTFFDLQKRLGRKYSGDFFLGADIPVTLMVFDLLWFNGVSLLKEPLQARRKLLEKLELPPLFRLVNVVQADSAEAIGQAFDNARSRSNEGLIVKNPLSFYTPGRRGLAWLKLKKEFATLDVAVVGAEYGNGRRSQVLSDYTFAVRDDASGDLLTIGKAYSGLTDAEIEQLTVHFNANTITTHGRYHVVKPDVILEVAFDCVQPSTRHESGLALRFPRIKAIRTDKTLDTIDTLSSARALVSS